MNQTIILLHMHLRPVSAHIGCFISETWHCDPQQLNSNCHIFTEIVISKIDKSNHHIIMIGQANVVIFNLTSALSTLSLHWLLRPGSTLGGPALPLATGDILNPELSHRPQMMFYSKLCQNRASLDGSSSVACCSLQANIDKYIGIGLNPLLWP